MTAIPMGRRIGAAIALSIGALALPASASAAWTAPVDLSTAGENAYAPAVAVDPDGDAVIAWRRFDGSNDRIEAQTRAADGTLGPTVRLSRAGQPATGVQLDVDDDGDAVFAWLRFDGSNDRVQARMLTSSGTLTPVRTLSAPGADAIGPRVAVNADGDAVFAWRRSDGTDERIEGATISATGNLSPVRQLSDAGEDALDPQLAVNDAGDAVVTWFRSDGTDRRVQARTLSASGTVSPIHTLSASGGDAVEPGVDIDPDGDAYLSWSRWDGSNYLLQTQLLYADGTLGTTHTVSDPGWSAYGSEVAVDDQGDAVIVFYRNDGANRRIQAVKMSPADTVGTPETLSDAGQDAALPDVAVDDDGDGVVSWYRFDGADNRIQAATVALTGQFGAPETLSDAGEPASGDEVAVDPDGDAIVVWSRNDGSDSRIQYSAGP